LDDLQVQLTQNILERIKNISERTGLSRERVVDSAIQVLEWLKEVKDDDVLELGLREGEYWARIEIEL